MGLSKSDLESMSKRFRKDLGLSDNAPLDPFQIELEGVSILRLNEISDLPSEYVNHLTGDGASQWSAMSIPLDSTQETWAIVVNDSHEKARQNVSLLEEFWHILQGHKLTTITKVGSSFGRSFEAEDEHDAYYLAAATLVPAESLLKMLLKKTPAEEIANHYGASTELVEYRIKRLGFWNQYKHRKLSLKEPSDKHKS
jgi:hypothetical protein